MKHARPVLGLVAAATAAVLAMPSHAAGAKTLFFDTQKSDATAGCGATYVLTPAAPSGDPCGGETVGYQGNQVPADVLGSPDVVYNMLPHGARGKLDVRRPLTGTVFVSTTPPIGITL